MVFQPNNPKPQGSGRKKGTPNKTTVEVRAMIASILNEKDGWKHIRDKFKNGEIPVPVFVRFLEYAIGKPKEQLEVSGPDGAPMEHTAKLSTELLRQMRKELNEHE